MSSLHDRIAENLANVRGRIADAAGRAGWGADEVRLVGVTKYVDAETARVLIEAGLEDLGESRPQELERKGQSLAGERVRWHLIGHLQRNKVRRVLPLAALLHSVDSERLLSTIDQEAPQLGLHPHVLLEVNISGDAAKHGFAPAEIEPLLPSLAAFENVRVQGLMTMAALEGGRDRAREDFARLRELRDRLASNCPPEIGLHELSMGMSDDFDLAIEEGATIVRVGSALFEGIEP